MPPSASAAMTCSPMRAFRNPRRRVHRRAGAERRRQDHVDARHPWAADADGGHDARLGQDARVRQSGHRLSAAECAPCCPTCGCAGSISSPRRCTASAGACRTSARRPRHDRRHAGAGRCPPSCRTAACRHVGRRAATLAAGAGADRQAAITAARRAADQPRRPPPGSRHRRGAQGLPRARHHRAVFARTSSTSCSARSTACCISATARQCSAPSTRSSARRCCRGCTAPTSRWCARTAISS